MMKTLRALPERVPLRVTLVAASLLMVTVSLAASSGVAAYLLRDYLLEHVDEQLSRTARDLVEVKRPLGSMTDNLGLMSDSLFIWSGDVRGQGNGWLVQVTGSGQAGPKLPTLNADYAAKHQEIFSVPAIAAGHRWRMLIITDQTNVLGVGISLDDVDDKLSRFSSALTIADAVVLAALAVAGYALVRASLRRLVLVERTAAAIAAGDLTRRVPTSHPDTEVGRLSGALNAMLVEIEMAFRAREQSEFEARASEARMRRFAADASHELRTPLTAIRGFAELYRQGGGDPAYAIGRIEHHATRMSLLVEDLLLLARLDQQRPLEQARVDLVTLAADAVSDATTTAPEHRVSLRTVGDDPPIVQGDESRLRQVIGNLVTNAVRHTPPGTSVTVIVGTVDGVARLEVADTGPGLHPDDAARVFERFFRTDPARTRERGGSGLGLSIVDALVAAHGGRIDLVTAPGEGARFIVELPLYAPADPGPAPLGEAPPTAAPGPNDGDPSAQKPAGQPAA